MLFDRLIRQRIFKKEKVTIKADIYSGPDIFDNSVCTSEPPDSRKLIIYGRPNLTRPSLVIGFEGWADAGRISSGVIGKLTDSLRLKKLAEIKPDDFYVIKSQGIESQRPFTDVQNGVVKGLHLPSTTFWLYRSEGSAPDLIISLGIEPELRWTEYTELVLDLAQDFGVERLYTIGGTYDHVPHSVEPVITSIISDDSLKDEIREYDVGFTEYHGPSSIHTLMVVSAKKRGIKAVSLWGHAPFYVQVPNAKVCYGILNRLTKMLNIIIDLEDLRRAGEYLDEQVNNAIKQMPELESYVMRLEDDFRKGKYQVSEPPAEDVIKEVEEFLKKQSASE